MAEEKSEPLATGRRFVVTDKAAFEECFNEHAWGFRRDFILRTLACEDFLEKAPGVSAAA